VSRLPSSDRNPVKSAVRLHYENFPALKKSIDSSAVRCRKTRTQIALLPLAHIKMIKHLKHLTYHPACPRSTKQIFIFHGLNFSSVQRTRFPTLHTYFISHFSILLIYSFFTPSSLFQSIQGEKRKATQTTTVTKKTPIHHGINE